MLHHRKSSSSKWQREDPLGRTPRQQSVSIKVALRRHARAEHTKESVNPIRFDLSKPHSESKAAALPHSLRPLASGSASNPLKSLLLKTTRSRHERQAQAHGSGHEMGTAPAAAAAVAANEAASNGMHANAPAASSPEPRLFPESACTRNYIPCQATFALSKFNNLLQFVTPGSIVALDIDDTLIKKKRFGSSLLSTEGAQKFTEYIQEHYKNSTFAERQQMVNRFYAELKEFSLTESDTAEVVRALQARGVYVFGLTARASSLAYASTLSLNGLGIDLSANTPPSLPTRAMESATGAVVVDGIVYCNDIDKGVVLQRLLQLEWVTWPPRKATPVNNNKASSSGNSTSSSSSSSSDGTNASDANAAAELPPELHLASEDGRHCPDRTIWFVDDSLQMILGMMQSWANMTQAHKEFYASLGEYMGQVPCRGKLSLVCCHYTHPEAAAAATTAHLSAPHRERILQIQIEEYLASGNILTDAEALQRIELSPRLLSDLGFAAVAARCEQAQLESM